MDLTTWLNQTVTYKTRSSVSNYGDPSFSAASTMSARVEAKRKLLVGPDGSQTESTHIIYTESELKVGTKVWLPGDTTSTDAHAKRIIEARQHPNKWNSQVLYEAYV